MATYLIFIFFFRFNSRDLCFTHSHSKANFRNIFFYLRESENRACVLLNFYFIVSLYKGYIQAMCLNNKIKISKVPNLLNSWIFFYRIQPYTFSQPFLYVPMSRENESEKLRYLQNLPKKKKIYL